MPGHIGPRFLGLLTEVQAVAGRVLGALLNGLVQGHLDWFRGLPLYLNVSATAGQGR